MENKKNMKNVSLLDCTLRDGGYCNNWKFGQNNIKQIIKGLEASNIEIIECGFLSNRIKHDIDSSRYTTIVNAEHYIERRIRNKKYVCMINYGEYDIDLLPNYEEGIISGIRVAFHKEDSESALEYCRLLKEKGYMVFLQPMVILDYTDEELLALIKYANSLMPYAFYIVDSFGVMKKKELTHIYYMLERNLDNEIIIGFHSHNNMQLSYSNAQALLELQGNRSVIIDTSIFGMGRGAGNLNTELFEEYLNDNYGAQYKVEPLISVFDDILSVFYNENPWGYSLANYLSATHNCHPNYAHFLEEKNTLTYSDMNKIFDNMNHEKKKHFEKKYIEELYMSYMNKASLMEENMNELKNQVTSKELLIIAAGMSGKTERQRIIEYIEKNNCLVISTNMEYPYYNPDYIFVSNIRRFKQIDKKFRNKMIVTSNIMTDTAFTSVDYDECTNCYEEVQDNATLMLIKLLKKLGVKKIAIAGLDGYSEAIHNNYVTDAMIIKLSKQIIEQKNIGMTLFLNEICTSIEIVQVTTPKYIKISNGA